MVEARKRNPHIKLYGLPWAFPNWLGVNVSNPMADPVRLAKYIVNWVKCAHSQHNLTIDYLGLSISN